MTRPDHEHGQSSDTGAGGSDDGRRIEGAADAIFARAQDAVRDVADRATHLAQDSLARGRAGVRRAEQASQGDPLNGRARGGASPLATALAVGAMGYAIATLIQGASRKRRPAPRTALPAAPAA
ncbi:hypothetical protein MKK69_23335 [Methylobacterium sp. J-026]|uniref:hypothetical protein n=1 Tax=Methylobacterium sp. J-026 TaxID=2836624 RepID=UPI001FB9F0EC|nr:hypothetical protein [Methylobacterium sp. J-026]MCJ2136946.1 hypothetical protein [Methylobacterium sp. J-026]